MKTILITRPDEESVKLTQALVAKGFRVFVEPLLRMEPLPGGAVALEAALGRKPQAILATSRRGAQALADMTKERSIPVFTVGAATAHYARTLGFTVSGHCETAQALSTLLTKECNPSRSLLYARGENINTDIAGILKNKGFNVDSALLYRAIAAQEFSAELHSLMAHGGIAGAMFFSRRTADTYASLARMHGLEGAHGAMSAICMSEVIAEKLRPLPWQSVHIAGKPDMEHMLEALKGVF